MPDQAPAPYAELLTEAFSQLDVSLEELQVAEQEMRQQNEALAESRRQLEEERERYRGLFEFAPDGYLVTDPFGVIQEANRAAGILLNILPRFLVGKPLASFVPAEARAIFRRNLLACQQMGHLPEWEVPLKPRRGHPFPAAVIITAQRDGHGRVAALRWMLRDATERQRIQTRLMALNAALERRVAERTAALEAAYKRERRVTQALQRRLLREVPDHAFPGLAVRTFYESASDEYLVGGDFFDAFALDGDIALAVGDVSGKGLIAASHVAEVKYALRALLRETASAAAALTHLNSYLIEAQQQNTDEADIFVVLALTLIDMQAGTASFAMAGAEPALILRAGGAIEEVKASGIPVGIIADASNPYQEVCVDLAVGDRLLMATDGITEARRDGAFLDQEGLIELVRGAAAAGTLGELGRHVLDGARAFAGGTFQDDVCLLLAERQGQA